MFPPLNPLLQSYLLLALPGFQLLPLPTMKTRVRSSGVGSPQSPLVSAFYKYLKPGELAQLRYSKITARSKQIGSQTLHALCQLKSTVDSAFPQSHVAMDEVPCFNLRVKSYPRFLHRKNFWLLPLFSLRLSPDRTSLIKT